MNKEQNRMQVVVVNCDKRRDEFEDHIHKLPKSWLTVPFENAEIVTGLEDMAEAANIPKVSVFSTRKGFDTFAVKDVKVSVLKSASVADAVTDVVN